MRSLMDSLKRRLISFFTVVSCGGVAATAPAFIQKAYAMYQGNPSEVTLVDVIACLVIFQNPGVDLTAGQLADGIGGILGTSVDPGSFDPLPTVELCDFVDDGDSGAGTSLNDVIATLVAFQNPGAELTESDLASGINGILGGTLTGADINAVPPALPGATTLSLSLAFNPDTKLLTATVFAEKPDSVGIEAGTIRATVSGSYTRPGSSIAVTLPPTEILLDNDTTGCNVGETVCEISESVLIDEPAGTTGTLTVTVNGGGFGIRRTATATISVTF